MKLPMGLMVVGMSAFLAFPAGAADAKAARKLVWSVNGKETFRYPKTDCGDPDQWPFGKPCYFLLDMQLGGQWVGDVDVSTLPVKMYIDWIRVYK